MSASSVATNDASADRYVSAARQDEAVMGPCLRRGDEPY